MIVNGTALLQAAPIKDMLHEKVRANGVSHGLAEAGYDIRIAQGITFTPDTHGSMHILVAEDGIERVHQGTRFTLASSVEEFQVPPNLVGVVHDKSTWARRGLSVFNTVLEPSWEGVLTLELVYHGKTRLEIPKGAGIAQILWHQIAEPGHYSGKYQNQGPAPQEAIFE